MKASKTLVFKGLISSFSKIAVNQKSETRIIWKIGIILIAIIGLFIVSDKLTDSFIYLPDDGTKLLPPLVNRLISKTISFLCVLIPSLIMVKYIDKRPLAILGLTVNKTSFFNHLKGMILGGCLILLYTLILAISRLADFTISKSIEYSFIFYSLCFLVAFISAMYEEVLFRGYIFQKLIEGTNYWIAQLIMGLLFGLGHVSNVGITFSEVMITIFAGFLVGHIYFLTRSLWMPIGLHWAWNFTMGPIFGMGIEGKSFIRHTFLTFEENAENIQHIGLLSDLLFLILLIILIVILFSTKLIKPVDDRNNPWLLYPSRYK